MHEIQENRIKSVKVWLSFKKQDAVFLQNIFYHYVNALKLFFLKKFSSVNVVISSK